MQRTNDYVAPVLELGPFLGIDASSLTGYTAPGKAVDASNLAPDRLYGGFMQVLGRVVGMTGNLTAPATALVKFTRSGLTTIYVAYDNDGAGHGRLEYFSLGGVKTTLALPGGVVLTPGPGQFVQARKWMFFCTPVLGDTPLKIAYDTLALTNWGIVPPPTAPTGTPAATGGALTQDFPYIYLVTFGVALGGATIQESSAGVPSAGITVHSSTTAGTATFTFTGLTNSGDYFVVGAHSIALGIQEQVLVPPVAGAAILGLPMGLTPTQVVVLLASVINSGMKSITATTNGASLIVTSVGTGVGQNGINVTINSYAATLNPAGPTGATSSGAGGTIPAGTYYAGITVGAGGSQSGMFPPVVLALSGATSSITYTAPTQAQIDSATPVPSVYNTYLSTDGVNFHLQQASVPIAGSSVLTTYNSGGALYLAGGGGVTPAPLNQNLAGATTTTQDSIALTTIPVSPDPQVNERNIYRLDTGGQFRLIHVIPDNATTTYTDGVADSAVTGQVLVVHRDPPQNFIAVAAHQNSVFGFGYPSSDPATLSDLWYSNPTEPWGFDSTNQVFPIGENAGGDNAVGLASIGSTLLCFKARTTTLVEGTAGSFTPIYPSFQIGCISQASIAVSQGVAFWLSAEPAVYAFDGSAPQYLSKEIKAFLDTCALADLQATVGAFRDRCYLLSFPTKGVTWMYDTESKSWWKQSFATTAFAFDPANQGEVIAARASTVDQWFAANTDLGAAIISSWTSGVSDSGDPEATKQYRAVAILAPIQSAQITVTVTADPGANQQQTVRTVDLSVGPQTKEISLPGTMKGREVQVSITTTSSIAVQIQRVRVYGFVLRRFGARG